MEITINSRHLELRFPNGELPGPIERVPVFTTKDSISGTSALNPDTYPTSTQAKLTVVVSGHQTIPLCNRLRHASLSADLLGLYLEGAFYWSTPVMKMAPAPQVPSLGIRPLIRRSTGPPVPTQTTIEHKHILFYTSMDIPVSSSDAPPKTVPPCSIASFHRPPWP